MEINEKNMKKVLFILHIPPPIHGSSIVGKTIMESKAINEEFKCKYINLGTSKNIDEIGKGGINKVFRYLSILVKTLQQLIFFRPQLGYIAITAMGGAFYKDALVVILFKLFRVKLVYHMHNKGVSTRQDKWFDNLLYHFVYNNTDVILLSKYLYPDIQKYVPETRVHYCPNGIAEQQGILDKFIDYRQQQINRQNKTMEILFLSNLIESKGVFVLLEACKVLQNKKLHFHCIFVGGIGDISAEQLKSKVVEFGLTDYVHYTGKMYGDEKEEVFINADIFAFPTYYHYECFPLVLLEAMQFSLPIVSTFEGGIPDVVENGVTGFLVPQRDVNKLVEKLEALINNQKLRQQMGEAGRKKYERNFTLDIFEHRMVEIIQQLNQEN
jgi:glycosyltransferase involved in cell wall biosynthesis